ncbi:putative membrane protein [Arthrobacter woluwensis]|uniref:DUF998 domain-containing protein n=1 Tax=Arthrobacter woluwensis TaxID=156980 RepID=UPI00278659D8|nr:DUF998 domain-containing protein [Arthrobacter woluwensis]MDQ0710284.1 putative membrane protein [Arthrobacter woluwensis]
MSSSQAAPPSLSRPAVRAAAVLFVLAACWYLFCETIAALGFPGYDYARNYISDLGVPAGGVFEGRAMESRLAEVMNAGFIGEGLLITLAVVALLAADAGRRRRRGALFALLLVHSAGIAVVGLVHGSPENAANGLMLFHGLGAVAAIGAGNAAALVAGTGDALAFRDQPGGALYRRISTVLGRGGFRVRRAPDDPHLAAGRRLGTGVGLHDHRLGAGHGRRAAPPHRALTAPCPAREGTARALSRAGKGHQLFSRGEFRRRVQGVSR